MTPLQKLAHEYMKFRLQSDIYNHECEKIDHGFHVLAPRGYSPRQAIVYHLPVIVVAQLGASIRPIWDELKEACDMLALSMGTNRFLIKDVANVAGLRQLIVDGT